MMSLETDLMAVLLTVCPRVYGGTAPFGTQAPYITWQHIGGNPIDFLDNTAADKRNAQIQVNAWARSAMESFALMQSAEAALRVALDKFVASPLSEPIGPDDEFGVPVGYLQSYSVTGNR